MNNHYTDSNKEMINKLKQKAWIDLKILELISLLDDENIPITVPNVIDIPDLKKLSYKIFNQSKIVLNDTEGLIISCHSVHEDPEIGDVTIGLSSSRLVFVNYGHVCSGVINFENYSLNLPNDSPSFFNNFVSDTDGEKWHKW